VHPQKILRFYRPLLLFATLLLSTINIFPAEIPSGHTEVFVLFNTHTQNEYDAVLLRLRKLGAIIAKKLPPTAVCLYIDNKTLNSFPYPAETILNTSHEIPSDFTQKLQDKIAIAAARAWNAKFNRKREHPPGSPNPLINDMILEPQFSDGQTGIFQAPYNVDLSQTSEFMMGSVAVSIIFVESGPESILDYEDWDSAREQTVINKIKAGLNWYAGKYPDAHLSYQYEYHYGRTDPAYQVAWEPIFHDGEFCWCWINEIMMSLGITDDPYSNDRNNVRTYNRGLRDRYASDWAFTIFVVDSVNDVDGQFDDGMFAFSYPGGSYMVMTYDNDGWGIDAMDVVMAHETGHIFWAWDEYSAAGKSANDKSGYLNYPNGNNEVGGVINETTCIMRGNSSALAGNTICSYTKGQIGWVDSDGDTIPDIIDTAAINVGGAEGGLGVTNVNATVTATMQPLVENRNTQNLSGNDVTIRKIADLRWRLGSGTYQSPIFDTGSTEVEKKFSVLTGNLADGQYLLDVKMTDSLGHVTTTQKTVDIMSKATINIAAIGETAGSIPTADGTINYTLPAGTFQTAKTIEMKFPQSVPLGKLPYTDWSKTGIGLELTTDNGEQPQKSIHIVQSYSPTYDSVMLAPTKFAYYDPNTSYWHILPTAINRTSRKITWETDHLSIFQLLLLAIPTSTENVIASPNPFRKSQGHTEITFSRLPEFSTVRIYTPLGGRVKEISAFGSPPMAIWDGKNENGEAVTSGTYLFHVEGGAGKGKNGRLVIIR